MQYYKAKSCGFRMDKRNHEISDASDPTINTNNPLLGLWSLGNTRVPLVIIVIVLC